MARRTATLAAVLLTAAAVQVFGQAAHAAPGADPVRHAVTGERVTGEHVTDRAGLGVRPITPAVGPRVVAAPRVGLDVARAATDCSDIDGRTYCLLLGWMDARPTDTDLQLRLATRAVAADGSSGEPSLAEQVLAWSALPAAERDARTRDELAAARAAVGKVKLFDLLLDGKEPSPEFFAQYPETKAIAAGRVGGKGIQVAGYNGSTARTMKQDTSYWCGPATMAMMAWNDPVVGNTISHSQQHWANRLGTTTAGSSIGNLAARTNSDLTWDNRVGAYVVVSIATWDTERWRQLFRTHVGEPYGAPIILHPVIVGQTNSRSFPSGTGTGGHFDMGRGFNLTEFDDQIFIFESAGAAWGVPNSIWEPTYFVKDQNLRNTSFKNIAY